MIAHKRATQLLELDRPPQPQEAGQWHSHRLTCQHRPLALRPRAPLCACAMPRACAPFKRAVRTESALSHSPKLQTPPTKNIATENRELAQVPAVTIRLSKPQLSFHAY